MADELPDPDEELAKRKRKLELAKLEVEEEKVRLEKFRLEKERQLLTAKTADSTSSSPRKSSDSKILEINVGGEVFATSRETLLQYRSPYFERLLEEGETGGAVMRGALRDEQGRLFIDRSPERFRLILEYLRGSLLLEEMTTHEKYQLRNEASYYQLEDLVHQLNHSGGAARYDPNLLSDEDRRIRQEAMDTRKVLSEGGLKASSRADSLLIDLFDAEGKRTYTPQYDEPCTSPAATLLFDHEVEFSRKEHPLNPPENIQQFKARLVEVAGPLFREFPFQNVVVAGGAVLKALTGHREKPSSYTTHGDVDIFLVMQDKETARSTYNNILQHLALQRGTSLGHNEILVVRSPFAVTIACGYPQRNVQIILTLHSCISEVVFNFDVDCCQVLFDGMRVCATPSGRRALVTGTNFADPERRSANYETRLAKYASRGFRVAVPGLDLARVQKKYLGDHFFSLYGGKLKHVKLEFSQTDSPTPVIDQEEVTGLAKLIVYAHLYSMKYACWDRTGEIAVKRSAAAKYFPFTENHGQEVKFNYLINAEKLKNSTVGINWKLPTPPHPPPVSVNQPVQNENWSSSGGGPLVPCVQGVSVREIYRELQDRLEELEHNEFGHHARQKPLCCYDYIPDVRQGLACPKVDNAALMFPDATFPAPDDGRGELRQLLEIPLSNQPGRSPWIRMDPATWVDAIYESDV